MKSTPQKDAAASFLNMVVAGKIREAYEKYVGPGFRHHNPYSKGDRESLIVAMEEADRQFQKKTFEIKHVLEDGEFVALHSKLKLNDMNLAVLHIVRFDNGKIVEFWDMAQPIPENTPNESTMF